MRFSWNNKGINALLFFSSSCQYFTDLFYFTLPLVLLLPLLLYDSFMCSVFRHVRNLFLLLIRRDRNDPVLWSSQHVPSHNRKRNHLQLANQYRISGSHHTTFSLEDQILLDMAAASSTGPWRPTTKHGDCLMLWSLTQVARCIQHCDPAFSTRTGEHYSLWSANQDSFLVLSQTVTRQCNVYPGTKNRSFEMELKTSAWSIATESLGFMGKPTTSVFLNSLTDSRRQHHEKNWNSLHVIHLLWFLVAIYF